MNNPYLKTKFLLSVNYQKQLPFSDLIWLSLSICKSQYFSIGSDSIYAIQNADLLIVAGTSLTVNPAAGLVGLFGGKHLVIINNDKTPYDHKAEIVINDKLYNIFNNLKA